MKATTLENVYSAINEEIHEIVVPSDIIEGAQRALKRMLAVPRDN